MKSFIDKLQDTVIKNNSILVGGFDPNIASFPEYHLTEMARKSSTDEEFAFNAISSHLISALESCSDQVAAIKPNIAFFEQYGIGGLRAFTYVCDAVRAAGLPLIVDAKRGDIGTTAQAYSSAFLGKTSVLGRDFGFVTSDALTVNPYLGFDTMEPYLKDCKESGKGIFVLVKTSNAGSADIQNRKDVNGISVADQVCDWIRSRAEELVGALGLSGLGAVVGATYPDEARTIRQRIPASVFLVPGFGAQGASADDALKGAVSSTGESFVLGKNPRGVVVNASRGLFQGEARSRSEFKNLVATNAARLAGELRDAAKRLVV